MPAANLREDFSSQVTYGPYSKHKLNPFLYGLAPYAGADVERTYCDAHSDFGLKDVERIPLLLKRGVLLGLWSDQAKGGVPSLLWTIDHTGWVFELRVTNPVQTQYHGYPLLQGDAFARQVLIRAREVMTSEEEFILDRDPETTKALDAAEIFYR